MDLGESVQKLKESHSDEGVVLTQQALGGRRIAGTGSMLQAGQTLALTKPWSTRM